jgi:hypothetical protein
MENSQYGTIPKNPTSSPHDGRTPVNPNADIPMAVTQTKESIPETSKGFQPKTA